MKGKRPDDELPGVPAGFTVRATHVLAVPGLDGERHLLEIARAS
jgi:16S rRNA (guanine527-N7)-methyltransferase